MTPRKKRLPAVPGLLAALTVLAATLLAGCGGLSGPPLPFSTGTGDDSYRITVHLSDLGNLVPDADVKVGDVTVGTVTGIAFDNWTAKLTVSLRGTASLPANAEARIAQKSLLGAEYLELAPPATAPPTGVLRAGDDIPVARTGHYPETEELLAALSAMLNQGGLSQLQTITGELDNALVGHESDARDLIHNVDELASTLNSRRGDIVTALQNLDRLGTVAAQQTQVVDNALQAIPQGLAALERQRTSLVRMLGSVSALGDIATRVVNASRDDLHANLQSLQPILGELADSGKDLTQSMGLLPTFPFASNTAFPAVLNGDYGNLYVTVDLDPKTLNDNLLRGLTIAGVPILGGSSLATGLVNANPLTAGLAPLIPLPVNTDPAVPAVPGTNDPSLPLPLPVPLPLPAPPPQQQQDGGLLGGLLGSPMPGGH